MLIAIDPHHWPTDVFVWTGALLGDAALCVRNLSAPTSEDTEPDSFGGRLSLSEPVWPSSKALELYAEGSNSSNLVFYAQYIYAEGPRFDSASVFFLLRKLWLRDADLYLVSTTRQVKLT